jgi:hypothetical protein
MFIYVKSDTNILFAIIQTQEFKTESSELLECQLVGVQEQFVFFLTRIRDKSSWPISCAYGL